MTEEWTQDAQERLRDKVKTIMASENLKQTTVAAETGIAYGTFTAWLAGTYTGNTADKAQAVDKWLNARREKEKVEQILPPAVSYIETKTATRILKLLQYCHHAQDIGVIAGGAGIGKTSALKEYQRRAPNVFIVTCEPVLTSPHSFLREFSMVLGLPDVSAAGMSRAIKKRLDGKNALIIVDESQHLPANTLDQIRAIYDAVECGLVFSGNESVYSRMGGGRSEFAQLFSRVGMRITQPRVLKGDAQAIIAAWSAEVSEKLAGEISKKAGALRGLTKSLRLAHVIAAGEGQSVADAHLRKAWEQIGSDRIDI